jgi:hypothetical protein
MNEHKKFVFVNFWGLGDLVATLYLLKNKTSYEYHIVTPLNHEVVLSLISALNIKNNVTVSVNKTKVFIVIEIFRFLFLKHVIFFTSPLSIKIKVFASFLSLLSNKVIIAEVDGNIYDNNKTFHIVK